jgi:ADP-ribosyl-[dinitrogen reductase] hydrolase
MIFPPSDPYSPARWLRNNMTLHGSCLCKAVQYEVKSISGPIWHCHCQTCRKAHAADHNTAALVRREDFRLISGLETLSAFESSPGKLRHFCSRCGSHIYAELEDVPFVVLRAATLDDDPGITPERSVWHSHAVPWTKSAIGIREYPEKAPS